MEKERIEICWESRTQVRARSLLHYNIPHPRPERTYKAFTTPTYSGKMTDHAARRIRKTIDLFVQLSPPKIVHNDVTNSPMKFQLNFITLTISSPDIVPCRDAYSNLLAPFLRKLRKFGKISYVWKGEFQKRGQPHYHITTNCFINWTWVRNEWNNLQRKHGYLAHYEAEHGHGNAPSTEVLAVRKLKRFDLYLAKYLSKGDPTKQWVGKVWGCSDNLRTGKQFTFTEAPEDWAHENECVELGLGRVIRFDNFTLTEADEPRKILCPAREMELSAHLKQVSAGTMATGKP